MIRVLLKPLFLAVTLAIVASAALADITGSYFAYGRNADGSAYDGTVQITQNADGTYLVSWSVGTAYSGTGLLQGQVLTVEWGANYPAVYVVMPDGELHGTWADGEGLELLSPTPR